MNFIMIEASFMMRIIFLFITLYRFVFFKNKNKSTNIFFSADAKQIIPPLVLGPQTLVQSSGKISINQFEKGKM